MKLHHLIIDMKHVLEEDEDPANIRAENVGVDGNPPISDSFLKLAYIELEFDLDGEEVNVLELVTVRQGE